MSKRVGVTAVLALVASLALPGMAFAQDAAVDPAALDLELDMTWIMVATALVFFMQAGFLLLEIGFSRQKNVGTGVAKILINFAIVTIAWWAIGYGIAEGGNGEDRERSREPRGDSRRSGGSGRRDDPGPRPAGAGLGVGGAVVAAEPSDFGGLTARVRWGGLEVSGPVALRRSTTSLASFAMRSMCVRRRINKLMCSGVLEWHESVCKQTAYGPAGDVLIAGRELAGRRRFSLAVCS